MKTQFQWTPDGKQPMFQQPSDAETAYRLNPARVLALYLGASLLFLRVSMLHQLLAFLTGVNFRLLYIVGIPALVALVFAGGVRHAFRTRTTYYWLAFAIWMAMAVPTSAWPTSSMWLVITYLRTDFLMLFVIGGLAVTWRDCMLMMRVVVCAAVVNLFSARLFAQTASYASRLGIDFGIVANPNDFAAHLLLVIPFLLWIVIGSRSMVFRLAAAVGCAYGVYLILSTASRGATVALLAAALFFLWRASGRQRFVFVVGVPFVAAVLLPFVPRAALQRISSLAVGSDDPTSDVAASSSSREYLLRKSITYTFEHPVFGVGPGQFSLFEGTNNQIIGTHGSWHQTHNSYTQVSSECGIVAALFYLIGICSTFCLLNSTYRQARARQDCEDIRTAAFCVALALVAYCVAIMFVNFAYFYYLPAMSGLAIAISNAAQREFASRSTHPAPLEAPL